MPDEQQLPADQPGPGESQVAYEERVGLRQPPAAQPQQAGAPAAGAQPSAAELRAQLQEAEARERDNAGATGAAAIDRPAGAPAGGQAAAALGGQAPQLDPALQRAPAGSLAKDAGAPEERMDVTHTEPILAQGATGEAVVRLVKLLASAGYASNTIVHGENAPGVLDRSVFSDVERFWNDHPEAREPDELFSGREGAIHELRGSWIGPYTWQVLYDLAGQAAG